MVLKSPAFAEGGMIPGKYTCDGADVSPHLSWTAVPVEARTLALICDDPDAPGGTWVHWVLFNLPASVRELPEQVPADREPDVGGRHGVTDFRRVGYGGPCPPAGVHRYFFRLYALDAAISLPAGATGAQVEARMKGHVLAEAQLMGRYGR
jgi:Raf kinase inhibitor-like YbhB/YbcL family protein